MRAPELIVLDEPTSFLDIRYKLELLSILKRMVREKDLAVLMSLHELDLAARVSDTVVCVAGDRIDKVGPPEEIFTRDYIAKLYHMEPGKYAPVLCHTRLCSLRDTMDNTFGTFYAVGVGPGDASLLTLQAVRILEQSPVIAAPQTKSGQMLALDIARGAVDLSKKKILPLRFTMSRDPAVREESYRAICAQLEGFLSRGQDVAMVNLGDVSIYATAYYIFDRLQKAGFPAKMVPGITSFSAVAAQLGWSLTEENAPLHIIPGRRTCKRRSICRAQRSS